VRITRRGFLGTSATLVGGIFTIGFQLRAMAQDAPGAIGSAANPSDAWIHIKPDSSAELVLTRSEMGQGLYTSLPMLLAEEADLDWNNVTIVQSDLSVGTGGSGSVISNYLPLRRAGAQVRLAMIATAARDWNVLESECTTAKGLIAVLDLVAEKAGWNKPLGPHRGRGIACTTTYAYLAEVAEVTVVDDNIRVDRLVMAVDCGQVVNPNGARSQIEGGMIFTLSSVLKEAITIRNGGAEQQNFDDYSLLRIPESPALETYFVDSHADPHGLGEAAVWLTGPAIANAIFAATGKRLRRMPFRMDETTAYLMSAAAGRPPIIPALLIPSPAAKTPAYTEKHSGAKTCPESGRSGVFLAKPLPWVGGHHVYPSSTPKTRDAERESSLGRGNGHPAALMRARSRDSQRMQFDYSSSLSHLRPCAVGLVGLRCGRPMAHRVLQVFKPAVFSCGCRPPGPAWLFLALTHLLLLGAVGFAADEWHANGSAVAVWTGALSINRFGIEFLTYGFIFAIAGIAGIAGFHIRAQRDAMHALELERQLSAAQLRALQMQLEPHFLFNTLNAIATLVELGRQVEAAEMLCHLNAILKSTLERTTPEKVPLSQELEIVENYLAIEQVRFADRLHIEIRVDPSALDSLIPCFLLQPIVENAIRHGIANCEENGLVEATARREGNLLRLEVRDTGARVSSRSKPGSGIGLKNTRERLAHFYHEAYEMVARPLEAGRFEVAITIPYERA
jgi:hypothetical protein